MPINSPAAGTLCIAFRTLGCRLNQYDTESMKAALAGDCGVHVVSWDSEADVYVLNSCTVTGRADQECRRLARQTKRRTPGCKVVVVGCYAQTQPQVLRDIPEIDAVIGNTRKESVREWLYSVLAAEDCFVDVEPFSRASEFDASIIEDFEGHTRAFVKVQDGCECRCSYCQIWKARGPSRSRPAGEVIDQLRVLEAGGFPEIVLAGIHLGLYGRDLDRGPDLVGLLRDVLTAVPLLRIRLSSIHPDEIVPPLLNLFGEFPNLRPHLHISLQSAADAVLSRMRRQYTAADAERAFTAVEAIAPHFGIGADVIVGFPGETEEEFETTMDFVARHAFSYLHVFRYSPRPGTEAAKLDTVMPETVSRRGRQLRELARRKKQSFMEAMVGTACEAVAEADDLATGRRQATTDNYVSVLIPASYEPGTIVEIVPTHFLDGRLVADEVRVVAAARGA